MKMRLLATIIALVALTVFGVTWAYAAGNGDDDPSKSAKQDFTDGKSAAYSGRYKTAIKLFKQVVAREPLNANAHNYLGYSYRKTGKLDLAATSYRRVFSIDPNHKGALEYQGELFLKLGDLSAAQQNLARLGKLCLANCKEFAELKRAIADFAATRVGNRGS